MKALFLSLTLLLSSAAFAGQQHEKMKQCNLEAKGKTGVERKVFMKECLSSKHQPTAPETAAAPGTPQERMKACNQQAAGKKGPDRKAFMSQCLSAK